MSNDNPKIQVFGSGCSSCKRLHELTVQAAKELGFDSKVEYVTDIQRLMELGVMQSPVLTIDNQIVIVGYVPDMDAIKHALATGQQNSQDSKSTGCCCGGNC
ncbi:thioredoxin family protein [Patescibacteria group bacterium]|nr:thioredoxin family protein [Patescibacteria group bacterium]